MILIVKLRKVWLEYLLNKENADNKKMYLNLYIIIILIISISSSNCATISDNYEIAKAKNSNSLIDNWIFFLILFLLVKEKSSKIIIYLKYTKAVHEEAFFINFCFI